MDNPEVEKIKAQIIDKIIEYVPNSVVIKTITKKKTGDLIAASFEAGESLTERTLPFDTFVQVIEGKAEIIINGIPNLLTTGQSIVIPANTTNVVKANERFKMISNIVK